MNRKTSRLSILFPALLGAAALAASSVAPACEDPRVAAAAVAAETPAPPAPPATTRPPRAPRASTPAPPAVPATPAPAPEAPVWPESDAPQPPRGWSGFAFQGDDDAWYAHTEHRDSASVWTFRDRPRVYLVDPGGPVGRAGMRRGDVITEIDGVSILTPEGGRRFGAILPGQTVRWTVLRGNETRQLVAKAAERPERREKEALVDLRRELRRLNETTDLEQLRREIEQLNRRMEQLRRQEQNRVRIESKVQQTRRLRYAGVVGDTEVEVRGNSAVIVSETVDRDRLVIRLGESVVTIQAPKEKSKRKDAPR